MTPEQFVRLKQLFEEAQELSEGDLASFVAEARRQDPTVAVELARMLDGQGDVEMAAVEAAIAGDQQTAPRAPGQSRGASLAGRKLGNIRVDELIGHGGMGAVYRGFDQRLERPVAIKTILPERRLSAEARGRFLREARLLSRLDHPAICRVYDLVESAFGDCLILELLDGDTLRSVMAGKSKLRLSEESKLEVAEKITEALVAAHAKGIVHRDLKPENVMIFEVPDEEASPDAGVAVKVLDFGLARTTNLGAVERRDDVSSAVDTRPMTPVEGDPAARASAEKAGANTFTVAGSVSGTVRYMSPEQARGESLTVKSDIYSLGVLLHELWTGESPYDLSRPAELLVQVADGDVEPAVGVPSAAEGSLAAVARARAFGAALG